MFKLEVSMNGKNKELEELYDYSLVRKQIFERSPEIRKLCEEKGLRADLLSGEKDGGSTRAKPPIFPQPK